MDRRLTALGGMLGLVAWCSVGALLVGGDPMLAVEAASAAVLLAWLARLAAHMWRERSVTRRLAADGFPAQIAGVDCRLLKDLGPQALVSGWIRPRVFVGNDLLRILDEAELRGVALHEEHHRRTHAPLRAAAVQAWLALFGRVPAVGEHLVRRLADLERQADRYAISCGATPAALASALLKAAPAEGAGAFSWAAEQRIHGLLALTGNQPWPASSWPIEWIPAAMVMGTLALCHGLGLVGLP